MLERFPCPVCGDDAWQVLGSQTFRREDGARHREYVRRRYDVLFTLWVPDRHEFTIAFVMCGTCGFISYAPRPTTADLDAKYAFLGGADALLPTDSPVTAIEAQRASELHDLLRPYVSARPVRILDFGGGRGGLMVELARAGCDCGVVDHTRHTLPGVTHVGTRLSDLASEPVYDIAVASHVFEHLADPLGVAVELRRHLGPESLLFLEVPLEIVGRIPELREPVTHVNFFSEASLSALLQHAGYIVERCWTEAATFSSGRQRYAVRALGRPSGSPVAVRSEGRAAETRAVLTMGPVGRAGLAVRNVRALLRPRLR